MPNEEVSAIYVRVSTLKEAQKDSPEHQQSSCEEKLKDLNLGALYPVYEDRSSGTSIMAREEVQQLVEDAKEGKFKTVIFAALSRFSRDMIDALTLKRTLVDVLNVRLISIDEGYDSKVDTEEFKFQIITSVNQKLSEQISTSSKRGIRESAKKGNFIGSKAPYGYLKVKTNDRKTLVPNPDTCEILKQMFTMYINGMGDKAIVNYLNENKIPSFSNGKWGVSTVKSILQNPAYTGINYFGKYKTKKVYNDIKDISNRENKLKAVEKSDWQISKNEITNEPIITHEALIPPTMFQLAKEIRIKRNDGIKRGGARVKINVFTGILFCGGCNAPLNSVGTRVKLQNGIVQEYRYLTCSTRRRVGVHGCDNETRFKYNEFREEIISDIKARFYKIISSKKFESRYEELILEESNRNIDKDLIKLKKIIEDNRKILQGIRKMKILDEIDEIQYNFEKNHYDNEIREAEEKLNKITSKQSDNFNIKSVYSMFKNAIDELIKIEDYENVEQINFILRQLIKKITVGIYGEITIDTPIGSIGNIQLL